MGRAPCCDCDVLGCPSCCCLLSRVCCGCCCPPAHPPCVVLFARAGPCCCRERGAGTRAAALLPLQPSCARQRRIGQPAIQQLGGRLACSWSSGSSASLASSSSPGGGQQPQQLEGRMFGLQLCKAASSLQPIGRGRGRCIDEMEQLQHAERVLGVAALAKHSGAAGQCSGAAGRNEAGPTSCSLLGAGCSFHDQFAASLFFAASHPQSHAVLLTHASPFPLAWPAGAEAAGCQGGCAGQGRGGRQQGQEEVQEVSS